MCVCEDCRDILCQPRPLEATHHKAQKAFTDIDPIQYCSMLRKGRARGLAMIFALTSLPETNPGASTCDSCRPWAARLQMQAHVAADAGANHQHSPAAPSGC